MVERGVMAGPFGAIGGSVVETARSTQQQRVECADIDVPNGSDHSASRQEFVNN